MTRSGSRGRVLPGATAIVLALVVAACSGAGGQGGGGGPILANPPAARPTPPATRVPATPVHDPQPLVFPRDDGPHDRLTEWWYYTGHVQDASGRRFGFEFVVFRAERGAVPVTWASHLAITDEQGGRFLYAQRAEIGDQVDRSPLQAPATVPGGGEPRGFNLAVAGTDPSGAGSSNEPSWVMAGAGGDDHLQATTSPAEAAAAGAPGGFGLRLDLSALRPPTLHDGTGWIDFGPTGSSYYYSRTRLAAGGSLTIDGRTFAVHGDAWFDHQWGDFIAVGGGWDWFAVNLADGTDLTVSLVRDRTGSAALRYGTLVRSDGTVVHLAASDFSVTTTGHWTSSRTGAVYPAGWRVSVPGERLLVDLRPTVADQELDTRPTTGVVYWEGSQVVTGAHAGVSMTGEAYVELTGYTPAGTLGQ